MATRGSAGRRNRSDEGEDQPMQEGTNEALIRGLREAIDATRTAPPLRGVTLLCRALIEIADNFDFETDDSYEGRPLVTAAQALGRVARTAFVDDPEGTRREIGAVSNVIIQNLVNTGLGGGEGMKATIILLRDDVGQPIGPITNGNTNDRRAKEAAEKTARETFKTSAKKTLTEIYNSMRVINARTLDGLTREDRSLFWATTILTTNLSESDADVRCAQAQLQLLSEEEWRSSNFNAFWLSHWSAESQAKRLRETIELIKRPNDFRNPVNGETWEGRIAEVDIMLSEVTNVADARKLLTHSEQSTLISHESIAVALFKAWKVTESQTEETVARFLSAIAAHGGDAQLARYRANSLVKSLRESRVNEYLSTIARTTRQQAAERAERKSVAAIAGSVDRRTVASIGTDGAEEYEETEDMEDVLEELAARVGATVGWKCHYCGGENHSLRQCDACRKVIEGAAAVITKSWEQAVNREPRAMASFLAAIAAELKVPLATSYARRTPFQGRAPFRGKAEGAR